MLLSASALYLDVNDDDAGEELEPILICRQYLLEAGCDPTLPSIYESEQFDEFSAFLEQAVPVCLRRSIFHIPNLHTLFHKLTHYVLASDTNPFRFRRQLCQCKHQNHPLWIVSTSGGLSVGPLEH